MQRRITNHQPLTNNNYKGYKRSCPKSKPLVLLATFSDSKAFKYNKEMLNVLFWINEEYYLYSFLSNGTCRSHLLHKNVKTRFVDDH